MTDHNQPSPPKQETEFRTTKDKVKKKSSWIKKDGDGLALISIDTRCKCVLYRITDNHIKKDSD